MLQRFQRFVFSDSGDDDGISRQPNPFPELFSHLDHNPQSKASTVDHPSGLSCIEFTEKEYYQNR